MISADHDLLDVLAAITGLLMALGGLGGLIGAIIYVYQSRANKRAIIANAIHTDAETEQTQVDTSRVLVEMWEKMGKQLEARVTQLEADLKKKDAAIVERDARITELETQITRIPDLELANRQKDDRISSLQCEVDELRRKVATLEDEKKGPRNSRTMVK